MSDTLNYRSSIKEVTNAFTLWLENNPGILDKMGECDMYTLNGLIYETLWKVALPYITNIKVIEFLHHLGYLDPMIYNDITFNQGPNINDELQELQKILLPIYVNTSYSKEESGHIPEVVRVSVSLYSDNTNILGRLLRDEYICMEELGIVYEDLSGYRRLYDQGYEPYHLCILHNDRISVFALHPRCRNQFRELHKLLAPYKETGIRYTIYHFWRRSNKDVDLLPTMIRLLETKEFPDACNGLCTLAKDIILDVTGDEIHRIMSSVL